jgi:Tfp pilus assembly protein FimT
MTLRRSPSRGNAFLETLIVLVILGITLAFVSPMILDRVRSTRIRVAADQLAMDLRAARLAAVSNRKAVAVVISADDSSYEYTDARGMLREVAIPDGVTIVSTSSPITFRPNGSVVGGAATVFELELTHGRLERRTVNVNTIGAPNVETVRL